MQRSLISALLTAALTGPGKGQALSAAYKVTPPCLHGGGKQQRPSAQRPKLLTSTAAVLKLATPSRTPLPTTWTAFSR